MAGTKPDCSKPMGDVADYMMELQIEEKQWQAFELADQDGPKRPLLCWADGKLDHIFDWEPRTKILGIFLEFHKQNKIGRKCFLSRGVPKESDVAKGFNPRYSCNRNNATHEVLITSQEDAALMRERSKAIKGNSPTLKERMIAEMLEAMADFIESDSNRDYFVFARTL